MDGSQLDDEEEEEVQTAGSMGHPFFIYEPHYQQMHPLIYYGDDFGYQHLSQQQNSETPSTTTAMPTPTTLTTTTNTTTSNQQPITDHLLPAPPTPSNRELHNEIERRRRSRIKNCCEVLKTLVPGLNEKTDKATVLEQTVKFMNHLVNCPNFRCNCEIQIEESKQ